MIAHACCKSPASSHYPGRGIYRRPPWSGRHAQSLDLSIENSKPC